MASVTPLVSASTAAVGQLVANAPKGSSFAARAKTTAQDLEAVFLSQMFSHMFTDIHGEGPLGGGPGTGVWRSFLTDEYAKSFAKSGGIGLANHVQSALLAQQEARSK